LRCLVLGPVVCQHPLGDRADGTRAPLSPFLAMRLTPAAWLRAGNGAGLLVSPPHHLAMGLQTSKSSITSKVLGTVIVPSMRRCAPVEERLCTTQGTEEKRRLKAMVADLRTRGRWTLRSFWGNQLGCNWDHSWAWAGLVGDHGTLLDGACGRLRCVHALSHVASKTRVFSGSFERLGSRIVAVPGAGNGRGGPA